MPRYLKAIADPKILILSNAEQKALDDSEKAKQDQVDALKAAEEACNNNYLSEHGSQDQKAAHEQWKAQLNLKTNAVRAGLTLLPLSGSQLPQLEFSSDPPVKVYMWNDGYPIKRREVFLVLEGLRQHPAVELIDNPETAQLVVWPTVSVAPFQ